MPISSEAGGQSIRCGVGNFSERYHLAKARNSSHIAPFQSRNRIKVQWMVAIALTGCLTRGDHRKQWCSATRHTLLPSETPHYYKPPPPQTARRLREPE